jgi:hypothetical protein
MPPSGDHNEIRRLLKENAELTRENNVLLKKMHRNSMIGIVMRIVWYGLLIGLPFALYFYLLEPYFEALGSNYETFREGLGELPGVKGLEHMLPNSGE